MNTVIQNILLKEQDIKYKNFHQRLMPTINPDTIIGIRVPILRKYAKELAKNPDINEFLCTLPHKYYEENNLHAFIIENINDYEYCISEINKFLPYVDNWATCDTLCPKVFKKNKERLLSEIEVWLKSEHLYTVRFAVKTLMTLYLDEAFNIEYAKKLAEIRSDEYYIKMAVAWYFATALAKQYDAIIPYITENRLDKDTHNKTIQKAVESFRITDAQKAYLKTLKRR